MKTSSWVRLVTLLCIVIEVFQPGPFTLVPVILSCTGLIIHEIERK